MSPRITHNVGTFDDLIIRGYKDADCDQVWRLHEIALKDTGAFVGHGEWDDDLKNIQDVYLRNRGTFLVAKQNGRVIGMGALRKVSNETAEIKRMRVLPEHQKKRPRHTIASYP